MLVVFGLLIALVGVVLMLVGRVPCLGRLPGDIHIRRGNWTFYFPLATSLLLSVVLTLILWILGRRRGSFSRPSRRRSASLRVSSPPPRRRARSASRSWRTRVSSSCAGWPSR